LKAINIPEDVNIIYLLACSWIKTDAMKIEDRIAVTFMTASESPQPMEHFKYQWGR
jgi:hypothetical protein